MSLANRITFLRLADLWGLGGDVGVACIVEMREMMFEKPSNGV